MKFTQVAADAFQHLQLNAGMILTEFDPSSPGTASSIKAKALVATSGGATFQSNPTYTDFGEDIDNVPANTKQLKRIDHYEPRISGTGKTANAEALEAFLGAFTKTASSGVAKYVPNPELDAEENFRDIWWVGDYSDKTGNTNGGFIAIKLLDALNTGGFQLKSNDKGKGDLAFDFLGHYDMEDMDRIPFEVYAKAGTAEPGTDATLASLAIGSVTLSPTFSKNVTSYTATTTSSSSTITATATDNTATVVIKNGDTTVTSGNSASWSAGKNMVTVTVTNTNASKVYTVEVTKS